MPRDALSLTFSLGTGRIYHTSPFASEGSMVDPLHLISKPLTSSCLNELEEDDIPEAFDENDEGVVSLEQGVVDDTVSLGGEAETNEEPRRAYRQRRQKIHYDFLLQGTPAELLHEAQRLATFSSSLYRRSIPAQLPQGEDPKQHTPVALPMLYHAVRVLHALGHSFIAPQADLV
jgi:hypothetical protein